MTKDDSHLAQFCADVSLHVGCCVYSSPAAQAIAFRYHGSFQRAENGEWLFLTHGVPNSLERQCLERDMEKLHAWWRGRAL